MPQTLRLGLLGLLVLFSACQVRSEVALTVAEDGSGEVEVAVGLDADAVDQLSDPSSFVVADDLLAAGWTVTAPAPEDDGFTWVRATRGFASLEEAEALLAQVTGDAKAIGQITLRRSDGFTSTTYEFDAVADLSEGLAAFSDAELATALDGEPLGESIEAIEARFGAPVSEMFTLAVTVDLPGEADGGPTEWAAELGGEPVTLSARSEITDRAPLVWASIAGVSGMAALVIIGWRVAKRGSRSDPSDP